METDVNVHLEVVKALDEAEKRIDALEKLAIAQRMYLMDIALHSYLEGAKAAPLRKQWEVLFEGKADPVTQESEAL